MTPLPQPFRRRRALQGGSTLIEVLVSVVLFSVAIIGLLRVLGTSVRNSGEIEYRSVASTLADARIGQMWVDRSNLANYVENNTALTELPNGLRTVTVVGNVVTVQISWQAPGADRAGTHRISATLAGN